MKASAYKLGGNQGATSDSTSRGSSFRLLINQGASLKYVSEQMGHASINITADIYGHLFKETKSVETNRLSMRLFALAPDSLLKRATGTTG